MIEQFFRDNYIILVKRIKARRMQEADAEDVVQEAFVRALKYQDSFNPALHEIGAWFNTILNNSFKDYRHANFTGDFSFTEEVIEGTDEQEDSWMDKDMLEKIRKGMNDLPNGHASIVRLVLFQGYYYKEAAQVLDERVENIRKVLYRFKQDIREKYGEC